jgi:hypothetical protein
VTDIPNWLAAIGAILGSALGSWTAVRVSIATLNKAVEVLEIEVEKLREWKRLIVAPYIPRAVDEHERRLGKIETDLEQAIREREEIQVDVAVLKSKLKPRG